MTQTDEGYETYRVMYAETMAESWQLAVNDVWQRHGVPLEALGNLELAFERGCRRTLSEIERLQREHFERMLRERTP